MSYQAITDIIVNPSQLSELQLSNTVNDSPKQTSVSFAEVLSSYTKDEKTEPASKPESAENKVSDSPEVEKTVEPEKSSEETEAASKNNVSEEKESEKVEDTKVEKTEVDDKETHVSEIKGSSDQNQSKIKAGQSELKIEAESKKSTKTERKTEKNVKTKKLSDKDFSRLDEITSKADSEIDSSKLVASLQDNVKAEKTEPDSNKKSNKDENEITDSKVIINHDSDPLLNKLQTEDKNPSDFDFSAGDDKNKKQFTLDKEGKIVVEDQRTQSSDEILSDKKSDFKTSEIKLSNENTAVMSVELNPNAEADVLSLNTQTAASNGSNFQAMLSNQLHNVAPEFVKAGNLILKDNNQGTINLILHPDDLGNVKIHLSLDGKSLTGHISVASKEALQVFKDNSETLREAFIKNGFDNASFDVSMNNGGSFNQNMGFEGQDDGRELFGKKMYGSSAEGLSAELDDILDNVEDISNYSVNIVA